MKINHLAHLAFRVSDLDRALEFYCKKLGLRQVFSLTYGQLLEYFRDNPPEYAAELLQKAKGKEQQLWAVYLEVSSGQFIELFAPEQGVVANDAASRLGYQHFCFEVDDLQSACKKLQNAGIQIRKGPKLGPDQTWQLWIEDPDGNQIEFHQYTGKSLQLL